MVKEIVRAREFTLAQGRRTVVFGRIFGQDKEIVSFVECPVCWALTMPEKAAAHAEMHYE